MKKHIILLVGPKGAGKSTVSNILRSNLPRTAFISLDGIRKLISDARPIDDDNAIAKKGILELTRLFLGSDISIVLDGGLLGDDVDLLGNQLGARVFKYQLVAPSEVLLDRVRARDMEKGGVTDEDRFHYTFKMHHSKDFSKFRVFDTTQLSSEAITEAIMEDLNKGKLNENAC